MGRGLPILKEVLVAVIAAALWRLWGAHTRAAFAEATAVVHERNESVEAV